MNSIAKFKLFTFIYLLMIFFSKANANCICSCVNGNVTALCESTLDIAPICPAQICPIVTPSVTPIQPSQLPPLGTNECNMSQVLNPKTGQYEWRNICQ